MDCFSAMFFKDFTTWGLLWILNLFIKSEKHFSHYFFRFSLCLLRHHMYWKHFFLSVLPHFPGASVKGISGCLLLPRSSLMLCPLGFVHPFSPASHFRVFICYQVSFFPCSVQFPFNLISIFLISDAAVHPRKFDLRFFWCVFRLVPHRPHASLYVLSSWSVTALISLSTDFLKSVSFLVLFLVIFLLFYVGQRFLHLCCYPCFHF